MITLSNLTGVAGYLGGIVVLVAVIAIPVLVVRWAWHLGNPRRRP